MDKAPATELPINGTPTEMCDILVGIDPFGVVTFLRYVSPRAGAIAGYDEKEIVGSHATDFIAGAESVAVVERFGRLYAGETAFRSPSRMLKAKSGTVVDSETYVVPSYDEQGKFSGHYAMIFLKLPGDAAQGSVAK